MLRSYTFVFVFNTVLFIQSGVSVKDKIETKRNIKFNGFEYIRENQKFIV